MSVFIQLVCSTAMIFHSNIHQGHCANCGNIFGPFVSKAVGARVI